MLAAIKEYPMEDIAEAQTNLGQRVGYQPATLDDISALLRELEETKKAVAAGPKEAEEPKETETAEETPGLYEQLKKLAETHPEHHELGIKKFGDPQTHEECKKVLDFINARIAVSETQF